MIKSEAEIRADRERARLAQEERAAKARERIARMKELEKKAALLAKKSDSEIAEAARKQAIRDMAEAQIDLNSDVVKVTYISLVYYYFYAICYREQVVRQL